MIYLDLDGVLTDFERHCHETGLVKEDGSPDYARMNDMNWFATMCAYPGARAFYDELCKLEKVRFLTAPIPHTECFGGKAEWIRSFVPEKGRFILKDIMIVASDDKKLIAATGRILIDDRKKNTDAWTAAGGIGIHHTGDYEATLKAVKKALSQLKPNSKGMQPRKP